MNFDEIMVIKTSEHFPYVEQDTIIFVKVGH